MRNFGFFKLKWFDKDGRKMIHLGGYELCCDEAAIRDSKFLVKKFSHTTLPFEFEDGQL